MGTVMIERTTEEPPVFSGRYVLSLVRRPTGEEAQARHDVWVLGTLEEALGVLEKEAPKAAAALSRELG